MSRVIIKNLPSRAKEGRIRELFSQCGEVTDIKVVKTRSGASRRFAFVGFVENSQAEEAVNHFNKTFIDSSKIEVELAKPYGDETLARPWSKYSKGSSAFAKREDRNDQKVKENNKEEKSVQSSKITKLLEDYGELEDDPQFQDFLDAHKHKAAVKTWADDVVKPPMQKIKEGDKKSSVVDASDGESPIEMDTSESNNDDINPARDTATSDLDYLKTKMVSKADKESRKFWEEESSSDSDSNSNDDEQHTDRNEVEGNDKAEGSSHSTTPYTVKMLGLPFRSKEEDIHSFFYPMELCAVRFTTDPQGRPSGRAYVDFKTEADLINALKRNRDCIGHRYIELFRDGDRAATQVSEVHDEPERPWQTKLAEAKPTDLDEGIAESGRLFLRNLPFSTTEEDLTKLFESYGPLTEVTVPLDKTTHKSTGLAFVTFMFPEHALKAFEAQDGQIFQGRLLHILPAKPREKFEVVSANPSSSYKRKKEQEKMAQAGSSHNWNSLFLAANAVVDAMADRYSTAKSAILDPTSDQSAAVRLALGETQLVGETREFLVAEGVQLELFEQARPKRSKSTILVKNIPFGTTEEELRSLFSSFGNLNRLILPPSSVAALVEFTESSHAKSAFKKLAYSSFKHLPLYLEWAPQGVMDGKTTRTAEDSAAQEASNTGEVATVFVKNLNFSTNEEALEKVFAKICQKVTVKIARKKNMKDPSKPLSMGFGFVEFERAKQALKAVKELQHTELDGHKLELKLSHRETGSQSDRKKKHTEGKEQKSAKILVRNIPFEATKREVKELFRTFGELKLVRLPKKFSTQEKHRGFGFVEYLTKEDAKRAFESLSHSTHLYGRRLVLEWAEEGESVDAIRKRTAEHFHGLRTSSSKRKKGEDLLWSLDKTDP